MLSSINVLKIVGHVADIATVIATPLVLIPFIAVWVWRGEIPKIWKALLFVSILLGAAGYAIDMADRLSLIPHETRVRLRFTADGESPETVRSENVFKTYSFQFADNGDDARDPKTTKWTILILIFDKPLRSEALRARVFFEGGSLRYAARNSTSRSIQIRFDGSMSDRVLDIEIEPI